MQTALESSGFPALYERVLVPSIFGHWAHEVLDRARPIGPSDRILDLGCGTGIVARTLRERLGGGARISAVDLAPGMIELARSLAPDIDWHVANAMELPFAAASFELVVSQQMLQFVPDPVAALREARRVLVPGGRLVLATWRARHELPLFDVLGQIAERHLGPAAEKRFALGDADALRTMVAGGGFADIQLDIVTRTDRFQEFPHRGNALAANFDLSKLSDAEREERLARVEAESIAAARKFTVDGLVVAPSRANLVTAIAERAP